MDTPNRRRAAAIVAAAATVMTGLTVHETLQMAAGAFLGDALYAVLIFALLVVAAPRLVALASGLTAFGVCALIEVLQLTGVPGRLSAAVPGVELVLGSTFQWSDLLAYAIGAAAAAGADIWLRKPRATESVIPEIG